MKLHEILNSEDTGNILLDTSMEGGINFAWEIYESENYSQLDSNLLREEIKAIKDAEDILKHPKIKTINAVTQEIREFERIINKKIKYFSRYHPAKNKKTKIKREKINNNSHIQLDSLQNELYNSRVLSHSKELNIGDKNYSLLLDMIKIIEPIMQIKKDIGFIKGFREEDRTQHSDTDERLTAALFWLSMFSNNSSCLITKDEDIVRLSRIIPPLIGSDSFLPYNRLLRRGFFNNSFRVYKKINDELCICVDSSDFKYSRQFSIKNLSEPDNNNLKERIGNFWKEFDKKEDNPYKNLEKYQYL